MMISPQKKAHINRRLICLLVALVMLTIATVAYATDMETAPAETERPLILQDVGGFSIIALLTIEKIELEVPVIGETTDDGLKRAPCLFIGPDHPLFPGNMVISAYNNRDGSQFGRLRELKVDDEVTLMDRYGDIFRYVVYDTEIIKPDDLGVLDIYEGERALTLLTWTLDGGRRLIVRCKVLEEGVMPETTHAPEIG